MCNKCRDHHKYARQCRCNCHRPDWYPLRLCPIYGCTNHQDHVHVYCMYHTRLLIFEIDTIQDQIDPNGVREKQPGSECPFDDKLAMDTAVTWGSVVCDV